MSGTRTYLPEQASGRKAVVAAIFGAILVAALFHAALLLFGGAIKFLFVKETVAAEAKIPEVDIVSHAPSPPVSVELPVDGATPQAGPTPEIPTFEETKEPAPMIHPSGPPVLGGDSFTISMGHGDPRPSDGVFSPAKPAAAIARNKPRVIFSPSPAFPAGLKKRGGSVSLLVAVGENGRVTKVTVEKSTDPAMEKPAIDAVLRWIFEPASDQGRKTPVIIRQIINFKPN